MPHIDVKMLEGRSLEQKRAFVSAVTEAAVNILKTPAESITVAIQEYPRENWGNTRRRAVCARARRCRSKKSRATSHVRRGAGGSL